MATKEVKDAKETLKGPSVEVVTDPKRVAAEKMAPLITITTGIGQTFHVKVNQPTGRALLIAVHL